MHYFPKAGRIRSEARYKADIDNFMEQSDYREVAQLSHHDYLYEAR